MTFSIIDGNRPEVSERVYLKGYICTLHLPQLHPLSTEGGNIPVIKHSLKYFPSFVGASQIYFSVSSLVIKLCIWIAI